MNQMLDSRAAKRKRSTSPPPWRNAQRGYPQGSQQPFSRDVRHPTRPQQDQTRLNQLQEDERMREWVAQEDNFVLKQAKRKAEIRVKDGRAKPIDWLAVTLRVVDHTRNPLDDEVEDADLDFLDPEGVMEGLTVAELSELAKDIDTYLHLEQNTKNKEYWQNIKIVCNEKLKALGPSGPESRAVGSISADIDRLLGPKTFDGLVSLEKQVRAKLKSDEPIDTDYWQQLLERLVVWKSKAKLQVIFKDVVQARLDTLRQENDGVASASRDSLRSTATVAKVDLRDVRTINYNKALDPDPLLQISAKDKGQTVLDESTLLSRIAAARHKVSKMGFVSAKKEALANMVSSSQKLVIQDGTSFGHFEALPNDDISQATRALYEREVARGVGEDEEVFNGEEVVDTKNKASWMGKYRPRKPKFFNRVQMGYEWNKYNQTHYDHDNPPPKIIQGYKFHIFYPDLIDKTKAPTYKIEREGGRKKGQSTTPAGQEDTCIIRFMSGPPYEDIGFLIQDRDWDFSAKHDRGFKSTFEKGILTLHFSFKKVYYRK